MHADPGFHKGFPLDLGGLRLSGGVFAQALQARLRQRRQTRHAPRPNAQKHAMPPSPGPDLAPAAAEEPPLPNEHEILAYWAGGRRGSGLGSRVRGRRRGSSLGSRVR